jgi:hypothetical protein
MRAERKMSNYPPGMSKRDFVRAGIDEHPNAHEHQWGPGRDPGPLLEDGAAVFQEECRYAAGPDGHGWQCEETRSYRMEYDTLETPTEEVELHEIDDWEENNEKVRAKVMHIEQAFMEGEAELTSIDPSPRSGEVAITHGEFTLCYRP